MPLAAAQALSLTAPGAITYYQRAVETAAGSDTAFLERVHSTLDKSAAAAQEVRRGADNRLRNDQLVRLATVWNELWMALAASAPEPQADAIRRLSIAMR